MIIPVGGVNAAQALVQVDRDAAGTLSSKTLFGVRYVELVDCLLYTSPSPRDRG